MASTVEFWTDALEDTGVVLRVYFHALVQEDNGDLVWHYWGTDPVEKPPTGIYFDLPIVEHEYVQFPQAFNDLPEDDANPQIYGLALMAGMNREGLT